MRPDSKSINYWPRAINCFSGYETELLPDTDSLYIDLAQRPSVESREVSERRRFRLRRRRNLVGIDIDHASRKLDLRNLLQAISR
jgi:uncharacterized protein YuzE